MTIRIATRVALLCSTTATLAGCYVVPVHPNPPSPAVVAVPVAPPAPLTFTARLYPSNDAATSFGVVAAIVTSDLQGRGHFSANIGGESYSGEATRQLSPSREGIANGAGHRGGYINCRYSMNTPTMGTGSCRHSSGATFSMHVGS